MIVQQNINSCMPNCRFWDDIYKQIMSTEAFVFYIDVSQIILLFNYHIFGF